MDTSQLFTRVTASTGHATLKIRVDLDLENYKQLPPKLRRAVIIGCNRAAKPVKAAMISNAEKIARHGFTAKSIGTKTQFNAKRGSVVTVIGTKMSFTRTKGKYTRGPRIGTPRKFTPWRTGRLVESGTFRTMPEPWLKPAFDATAQTFLETARREVAAEMAKVLG